ncbi:MULTISPECIES: DUF3857 domain-containing protein [unclassified Paraflavitalea]|uniref:DUF3857 domain-containing protein n=1 Tax=unclassified Paraflavitalea TaxID=2798305 RepID=UPI003D3454B5
MKYSFLFILAILSGMALNAQVKPLYAATYIPDSLKKEADVVVRDQQQELIIKNPGKGTLSVKRVVTILNAKGKDELIFRGFQDKFNKVGDIDIDMFDEWGNYVKRLKKKDLSKFPIGDGISIANDDYIIIGELTTDKYPVTVEINYTLTYNGFLEYPDFDFQEYDASIQKSSFKIVTSKNNRVRYKNYRCNLTPLIQETGDNISYYWAVNNVLPLKSQPGSAKRDNPRVLISPSLFEMDDYAGDMSSWKSFGKWQSSLIKQTNQLPPAQATFYRELVKSAGSDREKIKILYEYLQKNFRYVSIQLGIGGWKPFSAEFVDAKKYGDCKALSNFMQATLNAVNIKSHYAVINAGSDQMPVDPDFPQSAFNHVILCVPQPKDTIWLECTSRTQPFGVLGNFTENRNAFLITDDGGTMVSTPKSKAEQNTYSANSVITFNEDASGSVTTVMSMTGEYISEYDHYLFEAGEQTRKQYLINVRGFKQPDEMKLEKKVGTHELLVVEFQGEYEKIPDFSTGSKFFLSQRLNKFWVDNLPKVENRTNDYYMDFPLVQNDTTVIKIPKGFIVDNLPKNNSFEFSQGSFKALYAFDATKSEVSIINFIKVTGNKIPAAKYQEAYDFFNKVLKELQQKIVLKKE